MVAQTFRMASDPAVGKTEDASQAATALASSCCAFASTLCAPLASCDLGAVEVVDEACSLPALGCEARLGGGFMVPPVGLGRCVTSAGERLIAKWLRFYIIDRAAVYERLNYNLPRKPRSSFRVGGGNARVVHHA